MKRAQPDPLSCTVIVNVITLNANYVEKSRFYVGHYLSEHYAKVIRTELRASRDKVNSGTSTNPWDHILHPLSFLRGELTADALDPQSEFYNPRYGVTISPALRALTDPNERGTWSEWEGPRDDECVVLNLGGASYTTLVQLMMRIM